MPHFIDVLFSQEQILVGTACVRQMTSSLTMFVNRKALHIFKYKNFRQLKVMLCVGHP